MCKSTNLKILNGRTLGDRVGSYTRWPNALRETPSTLDYVLCDEDTNSIVNSLQILYPMGLSDHCCLNLRLKTEFTVSPNVMPNINKVPKIMYASPEKFKLLVNSDIFKDRISALSNKIKADGPQNSSLFVDEFTALLLEFSKSAPKQPKIKRTKNKKVENKPGWYNIECKKLRNQLNRASKKLAKNKFDKNAQSEFFSAKKKFSSYCKKCEAFSRKSLTKQL